MRSTTFLFCQCLIFLCVVQSFADDNQLFYNKLGICTRKSVGMKRFPKIKGSWYRSDCSGYVCFVFHAAGLNLRKVYGSGQNGVTAIWNGMKNNGFLLNHKNLRPGDLIFFDNTVVKPKRGLWNNPLTHIALVESVNALGIITYVHYGSKGVTRAKMHLKYPYKSHICVSGKRYRCNHVLRRRSRKSSDPRYLSGALYRGAARIVVKKQS